MLGSVEAVVGTEDRAQHLALVPVASGQGFDQVIIRDALLLEDEAVFEHAQMLAEQFGATHSGAMLLVLTHSVSAGNDRHFPYLDSLAEALVKAEGKGAIATFSPSGMSVNGPASVYHEALLAELVSGRHRRLGDALLAAQVTYAHTGAIPELLSLYHLFGDPPFKLHEGRP